MNVLDHLQIIALCMAAAAFLSGIETGVVALHRLRLRHLVRKGDNAARTLQGFLDDSDRLFGTTLVGTNLCIVVMSVLATSMVGAVPGPWAEVAADAVMTCIILVFAEFLPKAWFYSRPLERCRRYVRVLQLFEIVLRPFAVAVVWVTKWLVPGPSKSFSKAGPFVTKEEVKMLAIEGEQQGMLSSSDRAMIHRVLELSAKSARDIMVPRSNMTVVSSDTTVQDFVTMAKATHHTRMPVFDKARNDFVGIVNSFFVASADVQSADKTIAGFVRKPLLIPETMPVDEILPLLRRSRHPMCLVFNDKSEVTGLITTEDIVREVVVGPGPV